MAEWLKAAASKVVKSFLLFQGSNPCLSAITRWLYNVLWIPLLPILTLISYVKHGKTCAMQRLGLVTLRPHRATLWINAVSAGELIAALPFIWQYHAHYTIVVTANTLSAHERWPHLNIPPDVHLVWYPYDVSWVWRLFWKRLNVIGGIIVESELWPGMLHTAHRICLPLHWVNAKLSKKSCKRYTRSPKWLGLHTFTSITAQNVIHANRIQSLLPDQSIAVHVNVKWYALTHYALPATERPNRLPCVALVCSHAGEEVLFAPWLRTALSKMAVVIAPRSCLRVPSVIDSLLKANLPISIWCAHEALIIGKVYVVAEIGMLHHVYVNADIILMGGSWVPLDGNHNVMEPIAYQKPVIVGPYFNDHDILKLLPIPVLDIHKINDVLRTLQQPAWVNLGRKCHTLLQQHAVFNYPQLIP
jgi:3-deoxy-D-manno-octulosonic-acid transferase